jgi:hypothetical protein
LLVKNDTQSPSGAFNGVYYVTQLQALGLGLVLTRVLDYDTLSDINNTGAIPVVNGTSNANTSWLLTSTVNTVGTDPLTYSQFSIAPTNLLTSGGALGTPSSGTLTNCSGTAASLTAGNATKWTTGRTISLTGDVIYTSGSLDGSANVTGTATLANIPAISGANLTGTASSFTAGNVSTVPTTNSKTFNLGGNFGVAWAKYSFATDGGLVSTITPGATANTTIPANAILVGGVVNVTTAVTSSGSATVAIGCAGTGGSTTTLLAATAKTSLTLNAVLATVTTFAAPKKLTGAGGITFTIGTAALTAGVIEVWVLYFVAAA